MKIAIIGCGNMGGAIARGLVQSALLRPSDLICTARTEATLERMRTSCPGISTGLDNGAAVRGADVVFLAVKPWIAGEVLEEIRPVLDFSRQIVVSIVAGLTFEQLRARLCCDRPDAGSALPVLFRAMPNTAIEVGSSVTLLSAQNASAEQTELVVRLFNGTGKAVLIDESLMPAGTAVASCGLAFALRYVRAATEGAVELGLRPALATEIVARTLRGAADLLLSHGLHPEEEIDKITTPGGMTIRGLNELERQGFTAAVVQALKACNR